MADGLNEHGVFDLYDSLKVLRAGDLLCSDVVESNLRNIIGQHADIIIVGNWSFSLTSTDRGTSCVGVGGGDKGRNGLQGPGESGKLVVSSCWPSSSGLIQVAGSSKALMVATSWVVFFGGAFSSSDNGATSIHVHNSFCEFVPGNKTNSQPIAKYFNKR